MVLWSCSPRTHAHNCTYITEVSHPQTPSSVKTGAVSFIAYHLAPREVPGSLSAACVQTRLYCPSHAPGPVPPLPLGPAQCHLLRKPSPYFLIFNKILHLFLTPSVSLWTVGNEDRPGGCSRAKTGSVTFSEARPLQLLHKQLPSAAT